MKRSKLAPTMAFAMCFHTQGCELVSGSFPTSPNIQTVFHMDGKNSIPGVQNEAFIKVVLMNDGGR